MNAWLNSSSVMPEATSKLPNNKFTPHRFTRRRRMVAFSKKVRTANRTKCKVLSANGISPMVWVIIFPIEVSRPT